ncbi:hypothetical protein SUGI_0385700 [Cryptomeria japonica]|nr:hypothetical protein SUGI_0385700 [Cryptomeria japonica]
MVGSLQGFISHVPARILHSPEVAKAVTTKEILSIFESHRVLLEEAVMEIHEIQKIEQEKNRGFPKILPPRIL